jgi:hypothetical protein
LDSITTLDLSHLPPPLTLSHDSISRINGVVDLIQVYLASIIARRENLLAEIKTIHDDLDISDRPVFNETSLASVLETYLDELRVLWSVKMKTRVDEVIPLSTNV